MYIQDLEGLGVIPSESIAPSELVVALKLTFLLLSGDCLRCFPPSLDEEVEADSMSGRMLFTEALWTESSTLWKLDFPKLST